VKAYAVAAAGQHPLEISWIVVVVNRYACNMVRKYIPEFP